MNTFVINSLNELPGKIRSERIKQNLSQRKLAQLAGIGIKTMGTAELGVYTPHVEVLLNIAKALGYDSIDFRLGDIRLQTWDKL